MNGWAIAGLILAALVVAGIVFLVIQFKTFERGTHTDRVFRVDDDPDVAVKMHFAAEGATGQPPTIPRLLRWIHAFGFAMLGHIWYWMLYRMASRLGVAHELLHRAQQHILGGPHYVAMSLAQWLTQWVHNRRGMEEEVRRAAPALAKTGRCFLTVAGKAHLVEVPWLIPEFPNP